MRSWVDIEEGKGEWSDYCVMMKVRALVMFCGSVQSRHRYDWTRVF